MQREISQEKERGTMRMGVLVRNLSLVKYRCKIFFKWFMNYNHLTWEYFIELS